MSKPLSAIQTIDASSSDDFLLKLEVDGRWRKGLHFFNRSESESRPGRDLSEEERFCAGLSCGSSHAASEEFIVEIRRQILAGYAFVPFIGAGFSISAGNPIIKQLKEYLCRCICVALGVEDDASKNKELWNPRTDRWPPLIDKHRRATNNQRWLKLVSDRYHKEHDAWTVEKPTNPEIFLEAYGAMADWRTSLTFLSRLTPAEPRKRKPSPAPPALPILGTPSQDVIDACLRELMRDKRPSLNHTMLAVLSHLLRIDTMLTTNFDDLIEQAFAATRNTLQVLDVHLNDSLPVLSAVSGKRCIIKLHGSLRSLRADYSLDAEPSADDKQRFVEYLAAQELVSAEEMSKRKSLYKTSNHILVFGCGGKERRTLGFFKHALKIFSDLRIYWVCYSEREVQDVQNFASSFYQDWEDRKKELKHCDEKLTRAEGEEKKWREAHKDREEASKRCEEAKRRVYVDGNEQAPRIFALRHTDAGLLLLHLYQSIRKSVPPSDAIFPSPTRLSVPPLPVEHYTSKVDIWTSHMVEKEVSIFTTELARVLDRRGLVVAISARLKSDDGEGDVPGITSLCAELYRKRESGSMCLWIEMNDIYDVDHLFETFQEAAHYKLGSSDWTPLYKRDDYRPRREEIRRIVAASSDPWILFINAREIPGSNHERDPGGNGWLDDWNNIPKFRELLYDFHNDGVDPVKVVLLCRGTGAQGDYPPLVQTLDSPENLVVTLKADAYNSKGGASRRLSVQNRVQTLSAQVGRETEAKLQPYQRYFHHAISCMQRSRYLAVCWSGCVLPEGNRELEETVASDWQKEDWLRSLEAADIIRRKDGGFIWLHTDVRRALREEFRGAEANDRAKIHLDLAGWYQKVFVATGSAAAIFEEADHLCFSAECKILDERFRTDAGFAVDAKQRIDSACHLLENHQFLIQSLGYPQASLRRLRILRNFWVKEPPESEAGYSLHKTVLQYRDCPERKELLSAIAHFQAVTTKLSRNISREIGDDGEAYRYHRQFGLRMSRAVPVTKPILEETRDLTTYFRKHRSAAEECFDKRKWSFYRDVILSNKTYSAANGFDPLKRKNETDILDLRTPLDVDQSVEWWRWCAMLAIAARSFGKASDSLKRALYAALWVTTDFQDKLLEYTPDTGETDASFLTKLKGHSEQPRTWLEKIQGAGAVAVRRRVASETLHCIELAGQVELLKANTTERLHSLDPSSGFPPIATNERELAMQLAQRGMELTYGLVDCGSNEILTEPELNWYKARLLMIHGLAINRAHGRRYQSRHAMSYMADAAAYLQSAPPIRSRSDLALVELRRAEIRLEEAADIELYSQFRTPDGCPAAKTYPFEGWSYDRLRGTNIKLAIPWDKDPAKKSQEWIVRKLREDANDPESRIFQQLREVAARSRDALRFLDRAEPVLRERRRNVWWTTWYFERRMRAISYILWANVIDINAPIPFLGLEAAMRMTESEPDQILDDAIRMTRVDSYRLAMVMLGYASCARALQLRLALDEEAVRLPERLKSMRRKLEDAVIQFQKTSDLRGKEDIDGPSEMVIKAATERVNDVIAGLPQL